MQRKYTITIKTPLEQAFKALHTGEPVHKWMDGKLINKYSSLDNERIEGTKFHQTYWPFWELDGEIIAFKEPLLLGVGFEANIFKTRGTFFYYFNYTDTNETSVTYELEIVTPNPIQKKIIELMLPVVDNVVKSHLKTLKEKAEFSGAVARN